MASGPPSQMVHLPKLDHIAPELLGVEEAGSALPALTPRPMIRTRAQRRPLPRHVKKALRQLWRNDVKRWCESQDKQVDWGWDKREEQELAEWFSALDVDQSGTVEEDEIRALMHAMGIEVTPGRLVRMFANIGKPVEACLSKNEFVRFMTANADTLSGSAFAASSSSGSGGVFDANTVRRNHAHYTVRCLRPSAKLLRIACVCRARSD